MNSGGPLEKEINDKEKNGNFGPGCSNLCDYQLTPKGGREMSRGKSTLLHGTADCVSQTALEAGTKCFHKKANKKAGIKSQAVLSQCL